MKKSSPFLWTHKAFTNSHVYFAHFVFIDKIKFVKVYTQNQNKFAKCNATLATFWGRFCIKMTQTHSETYTNYVNARYLATLHMVERMGKMICAIKTMNTLSLDRERVTFETDRKKTNSRQRQHKFFLHTFQRLIIISRIDIYINGR